MEGFEGKAAVITGAGRGLGRVIALALAAEGVRVCVNDVYVDDARQSAADAVVKEISGAGGEAFANYEDVASWSGSERLIEAAVADLGRVDILVLCAGNNFPPPLLETTEEQWDATMAVHLKGHSGCIRAAAKQMIEQGAGGRIITISSRGSFFSKSASYATAKAGIMGLSAELARELAPHKITVNCLLPSATTQLFPGTDPGARLMGGVPGSLDLSPEAIAPIVTYLVSEDAGGVTGQYVYASGGDVLFYQMPLLLSGVQTFLRSAAGWTAEELREALPPIIATR